MILIYVQNLSLVVVRFKLNSTFGSRFETIKLGMREILKTLKNIRKMGIINYSTLFAQLIEKQRKKTVLSAQHVKYWIIVGMPIYKYNN